MRCPKCSQECVEKARFCHACGTALCESAPPAAQAIREEHSVGKALRRLMPDAYVERLLASSGRVEGERRVVTILFSDVKGSTAMAENLDPEEVLDIMNGAFEVLIAPITHYEGTLARLMGDAILAFFGAPIAHEDDPERACRAALEILDGVKAYAAKLKCERGIFGFDVRVGINTGLVVVAEVGADLRVEYTAMGDAVNLAARMEAAAEPGSILITDETHRLVAHAFETRRLEPIKVKGKVMPVSAFRLVAPRSPSSRGEPRRGGLLHSPLIGRETELSRLAAAVCDVRKRRGGIIAVTGEAGVGKSRLVAEARPNPDGDIRWIECRGVAYTQGMSFWVARSLMCSLLDVPTDSSPSVMGDALRSHLRRRGESHALENYPYLARLFNLPLEPHLAARLEHAGGEAVLRSEYKAFTDFIRQISLEGPLILVWDDLQCADRASVSLLESLLPLTGEAPLLLVVLYRLETELAGTFHQRNVAGCNERAQHMDLCPLTRPESARVLEQLMRGNELPEITRDQILDKSEGNPLFLEEVVHSLVGSVSRRPAGERGGFLKPPGVFGVPDTLQGLIMSRIDRLGPDERTTLQTASVLGRTFQRRALTHMLSSPALDSSLAELHQREFLTPLLADPRPGSISQDAFMFKQSMTQDVAYNTLLVSHRKSLHRRAGEALELAFPDLLDELSAAIASHFEKADAHDKALIYLSRAAHCARKAFANEEAIGYYTRALALAEFQTADASQTAELHEGLGDVYAVLSRYNTAWEEYGKALTLQHHSLGKAVLHRKMGQLNANRALYTEAIESFTQALSELREAFNPVEAGRVQNGLALVYYRLDRLSDALEVSTLALEILGGADDPWGLAEAYNNLGIISCKQGETEKALAYHQRCLGLWQDVKNSAGQAASHNNMGLLYSRVEKWEDAIHHFRKSVELCESIGNRHGLARTYDNMAQAYMSEGKSELAWRYQTEAVRIMAQIGGVGDDRNPEMWRQSGEW